MKRQKEKTTILFVNKKAGKVKPVQVSTRLIRDWKKYFVFVLFIFFALIAAVVYLTANTLKQKEKEMALARKIHSMHMSFTTVDSGSIRKKLINIDTQLSVINGFLISRGITSTLKEPSGGEADNDIISPDEAIDFYKKYLDKIAYNISYTPIGLPFNGSITSEYGHRENPFSGTNIETHKGLDIRGPMGAPVKAMAKGVVIFAGSRGGFGNCVIVKHGNGLETLYGHLSKISVSAGKKIKIGEKLGNIGSTGRSTGPHLHYEVRRNGHQINPKPFLSLN